LAGKPYTSQREASTAYMRVQMKMASDWSTLAQAGKWRSKARTHAQTNPPLHSPDEHTFNQINHCLIDGRHFSDVIDVMEQRGANIDSDHMLVVIKLRVRICREYAHHHDGGGDPDCLRAPILEGPRGIFPTSNNPESSDKHHRLHEKPSK
jgi:hypothetical protein